MSQTYNEIGVNVNAYQYLVMYVNIHYKQEFYCNT
jgi:hypothetical protein